MIFIDAKRPNRRVGANGQSPSDSEDGRTVPTKIINFSGEILRFFGRTVFPFNTIFCRRYGADFVKLFPNSEVKISYLKALTTPLSHIKFLAVGGVNHENMTDYFEAGAKGIGVATAIADQKSIASGDYEGITRRAKQFTSQLTISV